MNSRLSILVSLAALSAAAQHPRIAWGQNASPAPAVGQRPYELEWAHRTQDEHPPLVDFEKGGAWKVEGRNAAGELISSREQQLWGESVGKLTYRGTGENPQLRVLLEQPMPIAAPFNAVTCWVYGKALDYAKRDNKSQVTLSALFADAKGQEVEVPLRNIDWNEWFLLFRRLDAATSAWLGAGSQFKGFVLSGGTNPEARELYLDNLAVFTDSTAKLSFEPRPLRGVAAFPGQKTGTNTGPGKLAFPTRAETILPTSAAPGSKVTSQKQGRAVVWTYQGSDGQLVYRLDPNSGTLGDISLRWSSPTAKGRPTGAVPAIRPCVGGGVYLLSEGKPVAPERVQVLDTQLQNGVVTMRCRLSAGTVSQEVTYRFQMLGKSLVIDVLAPGGNVAEVRYGRAMGLVKPRLQTNPYYLYARNNRPAVVVSGTPESPLFLTGNTDWYRSNATALWAENNDDPQSVAYNGGSRYVARTDGTRNDCFERLILTASPRYEEVLPNIPNPKSPYMSVAGPRLWRSYGSGDRKNDAAYWEDVHRYGMTQLVVVNHETMWRDGDESFTFRTRPAPGRGGDKGEFDYARVMQDRLGYVYGPYNNYTDIAPINEYWNLDIATRTSDNQFQYSWFRTYAPKPARAVEYAATIPFELQKKFHYSTAYCDVHTAVAPWDRVDYDPRVPGAGTFAGVYYAYGEILELQKRAWQGPVYSEGGYHAFYSGLTDGNYAQDPSADLYNTPWFVDFDLRKMHPLSVNVGMGDAGMFAGGAWQTDEGTDRFLAATVAFGHTGYLIWGTKLSLRSYYMLQQLQSHYALSNATEIRYADAAGRLWNTSEAVARDVVRRSQIVTRYADGTVTAVNGNRTEPMRVVAYGRRLDLAPNGYAGWTPGYAVSVLSNESNGVRSDYAASPAYIYVDGRGNFVRYSKGASNGVGICRILGGNRYEIIPFEGAECGFAVRAVSAVALDKAGKTLGPAKLRVARGLTYVEPVAGAFSYRLTGPTGNANAISGLQSPRERVVAGETVTVQGKGKHTLQIPTSAKVGERLWRQFENQWIDFTVVAPTTTRVALQGNQLRLTVTSNMATPTETRIQVTSDANAVLGDPIPEKTVRLEPGRAQQVTLDLGAPPQAGTGTLNLTLQLGESVQRFQVALNAQAETPSLVAWPEKGRAGITLQGQADSTDLGTTGASVEPRTVSAKGISKAATFIHPPWQNATGVTFARYDGLKLPNQPTKFRAQVAKVDGSYPGNGIIFKVAVVAPDGSQTVVAQTRVTDYVWTPIEADLSRWAGQTISLKLITDPDGDTSGDWAAWAEMRITSPETRLTRTLQSVKEG